MRLLEIRASASKAGPANGDGKCFFSLSATVKDHGRRGGPGRLCCRRRQVGMPGLNLLRQAVHNPAFAIPPIHQLVQADIKPLGSLIAMSLAKIFEKLINSLAVA